jgi:ribosome-associated protein
MQNITIQSESIQLDQFLKWAAIVQSGGNAKSLIADGYIMVNGQTETRRSRKLLPGDQITVKNIGNYKIVKE